MNLATLPNPFDFANPVDDEMLFAGRVREIEDIKYYLDHAKHAAHAIHLALLGGRASGKTSLLNMIAIRAIDKGFCVVRVELDESDGHYQMAFFSKLFDALVTSACRMGAYRGLKDKTYEVYRNMVDAYCVPDDKLFCPFLFPFQVANTLKSGNSSIHVSDAAFKHDLEAIQAELDRPVVILLDECDVLGKSRVHIEKLRNIFMNVRRYMLVLTGTDALFPVVDDVFSPIVRQFKKITVKPFETVEDTTDCVIKPLQSLRLDHLRLIDFETFYDVIHQLCGGRPYEIRLVCHLLFRRLQLGKARSLRLSVEVLDDVLEELRPSYHTTSRAIVESIRGLDRQSLRALGTLCRCSGHATFEQIWFSEYVMYGETNWNQNQLYELLTQFVDSGLIAIENELIRFAGDDFDRIYYKYYARRSELDVVIDTMPFEMYLAFALPTQVAQRISGLDPTPLIELGDRPTRSMASVAQCLLTADEETNPFNTDAAAARFIYDQSLAHEGTSVFHVASMMLETPWHKCRRWFIVDMARFARDGGIATSVVSMTPFAERAKELGGAFSCACEQVEVVPSHILIQRAIASGDASITRALVKDHFLDMYRAYIDRRDVAGAVRHAERALNFQTPPEAYNNANNVGYLFMIQERLDEAEQLFRHVVQRADDASILALGQYNLAITRAKRGEWKGALEDMTRALERAESVDAQSRRCACLIIIEREGATIKFVERQSPLLDVAARDSLDVLSGIEEC